MQRAYGNRQTPVFPFPAIYEGGAPQIAGRRMETAPGGADAGPVRPSRDGSRGMRALRGGWGKNPRDPQAKPLLSWRVGILPLLGEAELYEQFKLDEPWDSMHNKRLLPKIPRAYAAPGVEIKEPYATYYQVFVGPHAAFEVHEQFNLDQFVGGGR